MENRLYDLGSKEQNQFDQLLIHVKQDILLRSKALLVLKDRGYDITACLKTDV